MIRHSLAGQRVTLAGAAGFVGTNLLPELVAAGAKVRAIVHRSKLRSASHDVEIVEADLMTAEGCRGALFDTDIFVMAAASSSGAEVMATTPLAHLTPNIVMNALTLEAAYAAGVSKYCFISSNTVYPPGEEEMCETDVTGKFFDAYEVVADMKLFSERMVGFYSSRVSEPMDTLIVRPANLYGPHDKFSPTQSKVIPALIRRAVEHEDPFVVWGDGNDIKDFLYISDFIEALVHAISIDSRAEVLNIASGASVSLREIIPIVLRESGHDSVEVTYDSSKPSMIPVRRLSILKARDVLQWSPSVGITEGLKRTVDWYRSNRATAP